MNTRSANYGAVATYIDFKKQDLQRRPEKERRGQITVNDIFS